MKITLVELRQLVFEHFLFESNINKLKTDFGTLGIDVYESDLIGFNSSYLQGIYHLIEEVIAEAQDKEKRITPFSRDFTNNKVPKYTANTLSLVSIKRIFIIPEVIGIIIAYANLYKQNVNKLPPQFKDFNKIVRSHVVKKAMPGLDEKFEDYFEYSQAGEKRIGSQCFIDFIQFMNEFFGFHITEAGYIKEMVDKVSNFIEINLDESEKGKEGEDGQTVSELEKVVHPGIHQVYASDNWEVFFAYTMQGSIDFGIYNWCTGYRETNRNAYNTYQSLGKILYYVRKKKERETEFPCDARDWRSNPTDYFSLCMNKKKGELEFDGMRGGSSVYANQDPVKMDHLRRLLGNEIDDVVSSISKHFNEVYLIKYAKIAESISADIYGEPGEPCYVDKETIDAMAKIPRVCKQMLRQLGGNKKLLHILHILNHPDLQTQVFEYICRDFIFKENPTIIQNEGGGFPIAEEFKLLKDKLPLHTNDHRNNGLAYEVLPRYKNQLTMGEYLCIVAAEVHRDIPMGIKYQLATKIIKRDASYFCFKAGSSRVTIFQNILEKDLESSFYKEIALLVLTHETLECLNYPSYYQKNLHQDYTGILSRQKRIGEIFSMYEEGSLDHFLIPGLNFPYTIDHRNPSGDYVKYRTASKTKYKFQFTFTTFFNSLYAAAKGVSTKARDSHRLLPPEYFDLIKSATEKDLQRFLASLENKPELINNSKESDGKYSVYQETRRIQAKRLEMIVHEYGLLTNEMANAIDMTPYIKAIEEMVNMGTKISQSTYEQFRDVNVTDLDFALKLIDDPFMYLKRYVRQPEIGFNPGTNRVVPPAANAISYILTSMTGPDYMTFKDLDLELLCQILSKQSLYQPIVLAEIFKTLHKSHHLINDKDKIKRIYDAVKAGPNAEYLLPALASNFNEIQSLQQKQLTKLTFNDFKEMGYMELLDYEKFELKQFTPINSYNETRPYKTYLNTTIRSWGHSFLSCIYNFIMNSIENGEIASWDEARGIVAELRERAHELNKDHEYYIHPDYRSKQKMETYRPNVQSYIEELRICIDYYLHPYATSGKNAHVQLLTMIQNREKQEPE